MPTESTLLNQIHATLAEQAHRISGIDQRKPSYKLITSMTLTPHVSMSLLSSAQLLWFFKYDRQLPSFLNELRIERIGLLDPYLSCFRIPDKSIAHL